MRPRRVGNRWTPNQGGLPRHCKRQREGRLSGRQEQGAQVKDIDLALADITPRAAAVTLLLFDRVVARYEREGGRHLSETERVVIASILRQIVLRDQAPVAGTEG